MKKNAKLLCFILSLVIAALAFTLAVGAEGDDAVEYTFDLAAAVAAAEDGSTVTLTGNAKVDSEIAVNKNLTIDLGGYKLASSVATTFKITDEVEFSIVGKGTIALDGELFRTVASANATVSVKGDSPLSKIAIRHTGSKSYHIAYTYNGTFTYENLDVVSSFNAKVATNSDLAFFHNDKVTIAATVTFDDVIFDAPDAIPNNPGIFVIGVAGSDSFLTVKDSYIHSAASGVYLGHLRATEVDTKIVLIENSTISMTPKQTYKQEQRNYALFLEECNWKHTGAVGVIDVRNSLVESAGRTLYSSYEQDSSANVNGWEAKQITSTINCYGSTIRAIASNYKDAGVYAFRFVKVNLYDNSLVSSPNAYVEQNAGGCAMGEVGTRVNVKSITTHTTRGIAFPDGMMGNDNSSEYCWIYDPVGNASYPYVMAKVVDGKYVIGKDAEGNDVYPKTPTPSGFEQFAFESIYRIVSPDADPIHYNLLGGRYESKNDKKYLSDAEIFWGPTVDKDGNLTGIMQFNIKAGSIYRGVSQNNQYIKFVITTDAVSGLTSTAITNDADGNPIKIKYGTDPYMVIGGSPKGNFSKAFVTGGSVENNSVGTFYHDRSKVVVIDFDFGTNSEAGYPQLNVNQQTRRITASSLEDNDSFSLFTLNSDGTIGNVTGLQDYQQFTLNPVGEWNHWTTVFYTDPAANNGQGIAYYYINGKYIGTSTVARKGGASFIQGIRFNNSAGTHQNIGAELCFDNISLKAYSDYLYVGEADGDGATGTYLPESYLWTKAPANKLIGDRYTINGKSVDASINEALNIAEAKGVALSLTGDYKGTALITSNGTLATNGYKIDIDPDSYGFVTGYDADGNEVYTFNALYNQTVEYKFYVGNDFENYSDNLYEIREYKLGNTPDFELVNLKVQLSEDGRRASANLQTGWITEDGKALEALTLEMIDATKDTGVKVYPVFADTETALLAYVKTTEGGKVLRVATNVAEVVDQYKKLSDGETYVFFSDVIISGSYSFFNDAPTVTVDGVKTVNGVVIDNDYTAEEIETMKAVASVINVDLNGYTVYSRDRFAGVSNNVIYNLYSSVEGGTVCSFYAKSGATTLSGQRTLAIVERTGAEGISQAKSNFNAHLNADGITVIGGFPVEGTSGDASCSMDFDNCNVIRAVNDSDGAIMCRYYYGSITMTNSIVAGPTAANVIDVRANGTGDDACDPTLYFENCKFLNKGGKNNVVKADGGAEVKGQKIITFVNCEFNGRINPAENGNIFAGEGNAAACNALGKLTDSENLVMAYYNVGMTLGLDSHYLAVMKPVYDASSETIFKIDGYYYYVDYGYKAQFMAEHPEVAEADIIELPLLTKKVVKKTDTVSVTYENLDGTENTVHTYVKGGYVVPETIKTGANEVNIPVVAAGEINTAALKIVADGTWVLPTEALTEDVVVKPLGYTVDANLSGLRANLAIYADFGVNLYIPVEYKDYITSVLADGKDVALVEVDLDGDTVADNIKLTVRRAASAVNQDAVITIGIKDVFDEKTIEKDVTVTLNAVDYAAKVLALESATEADKELMYQMLTYANEAIKFAGGEADAEIAALIGENVVTDYSASAFEESVGTAALGAAFAGATVDIGDDLAFVLVLQNDFAGKVTVKNGSLTYTFEVDALDSRIIRIGGMKVYNFANVLEITANGVVGEQEVSVIGTYNLATFVQYHIDGAAASNAESVACVELAKAFYSYAKCAAAYVAE